MSEHSPLPWSIYVQETPTLDDAVAELAYQVHNSEPFAGKVWLLNADGKCPASTGCGPTSEANAAFIVKAVNSHDAIVAALEAAEKHLVTLGGNPHPHDTNADQIQVAVLALVRSALSQVKGA